MNVIVVTGATSMIGSALIRASLAHGVSRIYAVVRPDSAKMDHLPSDPRIIVVACPAEEYDMLPQRIQEKCDVFYHIAWSLTGPKRNEDLLEQAKNVSYTLQALKAAVALGCGKFVGSGSQAEYGRLDIERIGPDTPVDPEQAYGIAKYAAGKLAIEAAKKEKIHCLWVRIFSVYGYYEKPTTMIASSLQKMLRGERASFTAGEQIWDYLFSEDAGEAFYLVGERAEGCKVYCLGSGEGKPLRSYIMDIRDAVDPGLELGIGDLPYAQGTIMHLQADICALQADTGFFPRTDFHEGIRKTIRWMREGQA